MLWGRGLAKSAGVEWSAIVEGALLGAGYVGYVSATQGQAEEHVATIKLRLESAEISEFYPGLANPKVGEHGNQYGWRQNFLMTANGWAIRPIGLDKAFRGGRVGDLRPTMLIFDDIDEIDDSPGVVDRKMARLSGSIIPAGNECTLKIIAQNLIHKNSVVNRIYTRQVDVLAERMPCKPVPAFDRIEIETRQTEDGPRNIIISGEPVWQHLDVKACQSFLHDSGKERFLAEYQHDFSGIAERRVIPEYDEAIHVITWDQFKAVFGVRYIPQHWIQECGHDIGYTKGHLSSLSFVATSAMNSPFPNLKFLHIGMNFVEPLLDDMATAILKKLGPDVSVARYFDYKPSIRNWWMSHEKLGERMTYEEKYKLPFVACEFGKNDGISQWRHYLRPDKTQSHPFHEDEKQEDGKYVLGRPALYYIVTKDQLQGARDDAGLCIHRQQILGWEYRRTIETDTGMSKEQPVKAREDSCDSQRMVYATWGAPARVLSVDEQFEKTLSPIIQSQAIVEAAKTEDPAVVAQLYVTRMIAESQRQDFGQQKDFFDSLLR